MASFCLPLRILIKAIFAGFSALFWSFMLLIFLEVLSALFMTQLLADALTDEKLELDMRKFIYTYYGTTSRTTLTMFQITLAPGSWAVVGRPLIEEVSPAFAWFFVFYVGGVSFAIIRIVTALFLRDTIQIAAKDKENQKREKMKEQQAYTENIRELFVKADVDKTGHLKFEEFQALMTDAKMLAWLTVLELSPKNACKIFELCDDGDGFLTLEEFLTGIFRLKGQARQLDMMMLQRDTTELKKILRGVQTQIYDMSLLHQQLSRHNLLC
eukprot:gnl/MRDRNA2_/MRDRNA2_46458_c0_seq1.p1 gnl/MRDRNA2_/MRDRNA2_46458_c0~~gnl/MRDRNA2_/MRDRNA2_46458_c0_seq1.p1  ORF type:complete len:290 (-),score=45.26 gnl/MRDRNA2_/MRDRNA2_46458_c0_seq1:99-908(-)